MGANVRSTVGTVTDANAMLRVVFSRIGRAAHRRAAGVLVQRPVGQRRRRDQDRARREGQTESRTFSVAGGMCPRCEGMGTVTDVDLTAAVRREQVARPRARITVPGYTADGWSTRMFSESGFFDPDKPIRDYTEDGAPRLPLPGADQGQDQRHQPDLRGPRPADPEVDAVQGRRRAAAAHPRVRRARRDVQRLPGLRRHAAQRGGAVVEDPRDQHRRRLRDADQRPGRLGPRPRRAVRRAAARGAPAQPRLVRRDGPRLPQPGPAVRHALRRRGAADAG